MPITTAKQLGTTVSLSGSSVPKKLADVIATYAGSVAVECFGIVGMAAISMKDGKAEIDFTQCLGCGVCEQLCKFDAIGE